MKKFIVIIILVSLLLSSCTNSSNLTENLKDNADNSEVVTDDDNHNIFENLENMVVEIVNKDVKVASSIDRTIGNISFIPKQENQVEFEYHPNLEGQEINLTDNDGWEWTFSFPQYALTRNTKITFTPLSEVQLDTMPNAEISGFQIEPDGLSFIASPKVTIKKKGEKLEGFLLSSAHDGSRVNIHPVSLEKGELQGSIPHFSTWVIIADTILNEKSIEEIRKITEEQLKVAKNAAREFLKKPITVPDAPSIGMECLNDEKIERAKAYAELVYREEADIVKSLFAAMRSNQAVGGNVQEDFELARKVHERAIAKVNKLYRTYKNDAEKFLPVLYASIKVYKEYSLIGGECPDIDGFLPWVERTKKYYMDRLVNKHDYRAAGAVYELLRYVSLFGGKAYIEELLNALTFKLKIKIVFLEEWDDGYDMITSEGEGEMKVQVISTEDLWKSNNVFLKGDIKIKSKLSGEYFANMKYSADSYTISAEVRNWDPCKTQSCDIWVSNLGLEDEKIGYYDEGTFEVFSEVLISSFCYDNFYEEMEKGFNVKINNLGESAVIQAFSGVDKAFDGLKLDILFDLIHTPKKFKY